jgi:hypothetical protein
MNVDSRIAEPQRQIPIEEPTDRGVLNSPVTENAWSGLTLL